MNPTDFKRLDGRTRTQYRKEKTVLPQEERNHPEKARGPDSRDAELISQIGGKGQSLASTLKSIAESSNPIGCFRVRDEKPGIPIIKRAPTRKSSPRQRALQPSYAGRRTGGHHHRVSSGSSSGERMYEHEGLECGYCSRASSPSRSRTSPTLCSPATASASRVQTASHDQQGRGDRRRALANVVPWIFINEKP